MNLQEYRNKLNSKRYDPLPDGVMNDYASRKVNANQIANSLQRLVIKLINQNFYFNCHSDDYLYEMIGAANEAIARAINEYNPSDGIFCSFVYSVIRNALRNHHKQNGSTVKNVTIQGKRTKASYNYIDAVGEDGYTFDLESPEAEEEKPKIDYEYIFQILYSENKRMKRKNWDIFLYTYGLVSDIPSTNQEAAKHFNITEESLRSKNCHTRTKLKQNEKIIKYLSTFL